MCNDIPLSIMINITEIRKKSVVTAYNCGGHQSHYFSDWCLVIKRYIMNYKSEWVHLYHLILRYFYHLLLAPMLAYNNQHKTPLNGLTSQPGYQINNVPDSKVHGANIGPTWVLSAPDGPHVGSMNFAIRGATTNVEIVWLAVWQTMTNWAPSQYKDRLSQVRGFPC